MAIVVRAAIPNALVFLADLEGGELPERFEAPITSTRTCLVIACSAADDAETEIVLATSGEIESLGPPAFAGTIATPSQRIAMRTVLRESLAELTTASVDTPVRVWLDHPTEPARVIIEID
jgi:hypothetical protein